ncbi:unnamed protein product [Meganyctiphanes norvegica]|uniref:NACHT domain-containing protein n=1 Tax=Meganyctiphanes norvegica TaxID=48144 RepID=A0AAV2RYD5_MEGNR
MSTGKSLLTEAELRYVRYWHGATVIGKKVMVIVLLAYTLGKITSTYKDELIAYYDLKANKKTKKTSIGLYKAEFCNEEERIMLEDPSVNPERFDITMIDKLLRRLQSLTGLAFHIDDVWTKDEPAGSNTSIEYLIYKVKVQRNDACHKIRDLSERDLEAKLNDMEALYIKLVEKVLTKEGKPKEIICNKTDEIKNDFVNLRNPIREALTDKDIEIYKKEQREFLMMLQKETKESCQFHLKKIYEETYETNPAEWLDIPMIDREEIFTKIVIKEDESDLPKHKLTTERKCDYREILTIKTMKHETPRILTINAIGGNGKTTYTRLFVCKWCKNKKCMHKLDEVDILLFVELRSDSNKTFDDILKYRLGDVMTDVGLSFQTLKEIILTLDILMLLDGQDESCQNDLLIDTLGLVSTQSKIKLIITTRPTASLDLKTIVNNYHIPKLNLNLIGIAIEDQFTFIKNLVIAIEDDTAKQNEILKSVKTELPRLNDSIGEIMKSPLMLTLLTLLWVAGEILDSVTTTDIFMKVNEHLKGKLKSRLLLKMRVLFDNSLKASINEFEAYLEEIAFLTFSHKEFNFENSTIVLLRNKLKQCKLDGIESEIFEHYLTPKKCRKKFQVVIDYSYKHLRLQEYDASKYVCHVLSKLGNEEEKKRMMIQLKDHRFSNIRAHTIAILAESYPQLLPKYGKAIIDCEKNSRNIDAYLSLVLESKANSTVVEMVSANMAKMSHWVINSTSSLASIMVVMKITQPRKFSLSLIDGIQFPDFFSSCLREISIYNLDLVLVLPYNAPNDSTAQVTHDDYLRSITYPEACVRLVEFWGRLSRAGLKQLPPTLNELQVGLIVDDLPVLFQMIPDLLKLDSLDIHMWGSNLECVTNLPQLHPSNNLELWIHLYVENGDCHHISKLLQQCFSPARVEDGYLCLWDANITGEGVIRLLQCLCDHQVKCSKIEIHSNQPPTLQEEIKNQARNCINYCIIWQCEGVTYDLTPN